MKELFEVARNRNLALVLGGRIVSAGGDFVYQIALSIAVYNYSAHSSLFAHHATLAVSLFWLARLIPGVVLGAPAGLLADRMGYQRAMIVGDLGRMVIVGVMGALVATVPPHPTSNSWLLLYPLVFLVSCFGTLFGPASVALVPAIVENRDQRMAANAAIGEIANIASIVGSALGGILAAAGLTTELLLADAVTFGVSALSLFAIRMPSAAPAASSGEEDEESEEKAGGLLGGFRLIGSRPLLLFAVAVMALPELASGAVIVWIVPYAHDVFPSGDAGVGYLSAAMGVGGVIGGLVAAGIGSNIRLDTLLAIGVACLGVMLAALGIVHLWVAALVCLAIVSLAETLEYAAYETLLQQAVPENMIGRAAGSIDTVFINLMLVGNLVSGVLAATIGLRVSITAAGILILVTTGVAWMNLRRTTRGQPDPELLARIPAFAAVPLAVREWAVRRMVREQFATGSVIIRQGDEGDRFYTIASGRAEVEIETGGATMRRELVHGDFFGEIALLEHVPRTATVRAIDELTVYAMSREDFEELQDRAVDFKKSLLETASMRAEEDRNFRLTFAERLG